MLDYEKQFYSNKVKLIVGLDEAGRGPLCGPVVAAAVIFPKDFYNEEINDSKKLTSKKREELYKVIIENAVAYGIGIVDAKTIDEINIYEAAKLAMIRALENMNYEFDLIVSDYMPLKFNNIEAIPIAKGDAKCLCIAAASILAKVTRDNIMDKYAEYYPEYDLKNNKGYGTKKHLEALEKYGPIEGFHRMTFKPIAKKDFEQLKLF